MLLVVLVDAQIVLGAFVVWSALQPNINTIHVVNGALVLGTSLVLTLRSYRTRLLASESRVSRGGTRRVTRGASPVPDALRSAGHVGMTGDRRPPAVEKGSHA